MTDHEKKIELMRKYYLDIRTSYDFFVKGDIPSKRVDNALRKFASGMDRTSMIGFYDTTITGSGKNGYIFTDTKVYYLETLEKPKKLWYDDIKGVKLINKDKIKDCDRSLMFELYDGTTVIWASCFLNKTPLFHFFNELLEMINSSEGLQEGSVDYKKRFEAGIVAGGSSVGALGTVNKVYDEEKFHARQGHGFAAERANHLYDKMTGHDAKIVGDDNAINGADRIVDGIEIQSKYCATGSRCIKECFAEDGKGNFRYYSKNGRPMQIEVPSDKYDAAVSAMEEKIKRGQVNGVTDPAEAKNIVRKGHFTYEQAKNIAKAGTVESLAYDAVNGAIIASSAFGVSAVLTFATSVWNGEDFDIALKNAAYTGIKVGGTAFVTSVLVSQLSKAGLNSALVGSSEALVNVMGPKASAMLVNAIRGGSNIYGAAAMKSAAKLLRGNVITAGVTVVVLSSFDIANIFRGRISGKQLFRNLANTTSTVAGGTAGWVGGAAIGSAILPGIGTVVGGLIGSISAGAVANKVTDTALGTFIEDDADEMVRIIEKQFAELAADYLLNQKEAEKVADALQGSLDGKKLKDMYSSGDRKEFARNLLVPLIENQVSGRKVIALPTNEQMSIGLKEALEDIADLADGQTA